MHLVERHIIKQNNKLWKEMDLLSFLSKNIYNYANYLVRQKFIETTKQKENGEVKHATYLNYYDIRRMVLKQIDYCSLPRKVSNQTLMLLDKNWKSFFKSIKDWKKNPYKYNGIPKLPNYKHKTKGRFVLIYELGAVSKKRLKNNIIKLSGTNIEIPYINYKEKLNQVRIIPRSKSYIIEIIYEKSENVSKEINGRYCSIDLGVNNLATIGSNILIPTIINGKPLKSINQYYNKKRSKFKSKLGHYKNNKNEIKQYGTCNKIEKLTQKRNNKINDYLHKASRYIINHLVSHNINTLVIGNNKKWKQEINISNRNNQNFVNIPHSKFINMLVYKAKMEGINTIIMEESYTSKCSFLDNEMIEKHIKYKGRRIKRGLFKSKSGKLINADLNGSLNILRKAVPNIKFDNGIEVVAVSPKVFTLNN